MRRFRKQDGPIALTVAVGLILASPVGGLAQASPYLPVFDRAYDDLEALVVAGLVQDIVLAQRAHSRMAFARFAVEARGKLPPAGAHGTKRRFTEALARLEARFSPEVALLCDDGGAACATPKASAAVREIESEATWADSPPRAVPTPYAEASFVDADLNPLLQRNQGRVLADGGTIAAEAVLDVTLGSAVAAQLRPRVWANAPDVGAAGSHVTLLAGYLRAMAGNLSIEVGRNPVPRGYGQDAGPLVSRNARGMDMVRLSMERPARLPSVLGLMGPVAVAGYIADMGADREFPHSKLIVLEGSLRPHANLELGGSILNHQGGEGAPEATFGERLADVFGFLDWAVGVFGHQEFSDKAVAVDARLTLPAPRAEVFLSFATTDINVPNPSSYTTEAVWMGGLRFLGLGRNGRTDVWVEGRHTGVRPHTHHQFVSGLTVDGRLIGDAMGPLSHGLRVGIDWTGANQTVSVAAAAEKYRGDTIGTNGLEDTDFRWIVTSDNPDEVRLRATLDWTRHPVLTGLRTTVRLGYEHVNRFDFTGENRPNVLAQVRVAYVW